VRCKLPQPYKTRGKEKTHYSTIDSGAEQDKVKEIEMKIAQP